MFRKRISYLKKRRIYIFVGAHPGAGVRHLCLSLAELSANVFLRKTVLLEISPKSRLTEILGETTVIKGNAVGYKNFGVDIFPEFPHPEVQKLLTEDYEDIIISLSLEEIADVILPADAAWFLLGSLKPWHIGDYKLLFRKLSINGLALGRCLSFGLLAYEKSFFEKEFKRSVEEIPFIPDPFLLQRSQIDFLKTLYGV
ncbi:MAG: hypothetical protein K6F00_08125 [Lachnospiraceae bacterium]|nr:hypothetical protein [Lachnospiraceae bacterium]